MSYEWGRAPEAGKWQRAIPVWFMSVVLVALVSGIGMWWVRQALVWTPLQQFYLSAYVRSALASSLAIQTGRYRLLLMESRHGTRHLLTFRPTAEELASWLCHDEELDRRIHGTPYASIIDRQRNARSFVMHRRSPARRLRPPRADFRVPGFMYALGSIIDRWRR